MDMSKRHAQQTKKVIRLNKIGSRKNVNAYVIIFLK